MKKKFLFNILSLIIFIGIFGFTFVHKSNAAQIVDKGSLKITESSLKLDVNTGDNYVIVEVWNQQGKKELGPKTFGPAITKNSMGVVEVNLDISTLYRGITFTLKVKDKNPNSGGDTGEINFNTVSQDTRVGGAGDYYYSDIDSLINNYENKRSASMFRFTTPALCEASRIKRIDEIHQLHTIGDSTHGYIGGSITPCYKSTTIPTKDELKAKMISTEKVAGSELYYFTYHGVTIGVFNRSRGWVDKKNCDSSEKIMQEHVEMRCTASTTPPQRPDNWDDSVSAVNPTESSVKRVFNEEYSLLEPLPGLSKIDQGKKVGDYLNIIFKFAISICAGLAVLMIVIYGVQYMGDGSIFGHTEAKSKIGSAIMGLLLALGAYALLNTINPDLVGSGGININQVSITLASSAREQRLSETQKSDVKFYRTSYYDKVKSIIASDSRYKIPHCLMQVAVQRESAGNPNKLFLVGHDEDVANSGIGSRLDFIKSGKTFKGVTFAYNNALITKSNFLNDDHGKNGIYSAPDLNADDLGLDWRFSHGMGLAGVTFFPKGSTRGANYDKGATMPISGTKFFPKDLKNIDIDLKAATEIMTAAYNKCGTAEGAYRSYGSGNCKGNNAFTNVEAPLRTNLYNQCVAQDK